MKTAIVTKYGNSDVIKIVQTKKPSPKANQILIKIKAFGVTSGDVRIRSASFPDGFGIVARLALGIFGPRNNVLGSEFSGIVEEVGSQVTSFKPGDKVMGFRVFNIYAEYACLKETDALVIMPENLNFEQAATIPFGASTALYFLDIANLKPGQNVLINGSSGSVGLNAVQIASSKKAYVTAVCSGQNVDLVASAGAYQTIDYQKVSLKNLSDRYDVIFDTVGNLNFDNYKHLLNSDGVFLQAVATFGDLFAKKDREDGKKFLTGTAPETKQSLLVLRQMILDGKLKPYVDKIFEFDDIAQAHKYVETGRKKGGVAVRISI